MSGAGLGRGNASSGLGSGEGNSDTGSLVGLVNDVQIDPAGNVWAANNWNLVEAATAEDPARPTSTWGGGSGITVIYGVAAPVQPPRMGQVRAAN